MLTGSEGTSKNADDLELDIEKFTDQSTSFFADRIKLVKFTCTLGESRCFSCRNRKMYYKPSKITPSTNAAFLQYLISHPSNIRLRQRCICTTHPHLYTPLKYPIVPDNFFNRDYLRNMYDKSGSPLTTLCTILSCSSSSLDF